jgi:hypothetical protein
MPCDCSFNAYYQKPDKSFLIIESLSYQHDTSRVWHEGENGQTPAVGMLHLKQDFQEEGAQIADLLSFVDL